MKRYVTYAVVYGAIGVAIGLGLAYWTSTGEAGAIPILLRKNGKTVEEPSVKHE